MHVKVEGVMAVEVHVLVRHSRVRGLAGRARFDFRWEPTRSIWIVTNAMLMSELRGSQAFLLLPIDSLACDTGRDSPR